jgi:hypothetical protein
MKRSPESYLPRSLCAYVGLAAGQTARFSGHRSVVVPLAGKRCFRASAPIPAQTD